MDRRNPIEGGGTAGRASGGGTAGQSPAGDRLEAFAPALRAAARRFGTPLYVTDAAALDAAASAVRAAFPDPWLRAYSLKANDLPAIVARVAAQGFGANVVSRGEWALARRAGLPNAAITLEGIGKTDADLRAAARAAADGEPLRWVAVESADEAAALARAVLAARRQFRGGNDRALRIDALVRLNPAVEPETQAGLATGSRASKFGVGSDEIGRVIEAGGGPDGPIRWRGLHLHVGSQLGAVDAWRDAVRRALALLALIRGGMPDFDTLDIGGGMPVAPWSPGQDPGLAEAGATASRRGAPAGPSAATRAALPRGPASTRLPDLDAAPQPAAVPGPERFAAELPALLEAIPPDRRPRRLAVEPGRVVVASAGWLVARVLHVRERTLSLETSPAERAGVHALAVLPPGASTDDRTRRLIVIDAGMTELIRPALYGAEHAVVALTSLGRAVQPGPGARLAGRAGRRHGDHLRPVRVDGPICESTDTLGEHLLPPLRRGDLVAIADAGAYAASMRSPYNGRPRPAEVIVEPDGTLTPARRRGTPGSLG
jgi:diaminopimelate decarboxylase